MKVKELIEILQKVYQESLVVFDGYEGGYDTISDIEQIQVTGPLQREWYYGKYEDSPEDELFKINAVYFVK
jgi:hypothetical protein